MMKISTPKAGGPYILRLNNGQKIISNVLVGEVWICSGQSNMDVPMAGVASVNPPVVIEEAETAIAQSSNDEIRSFSMKWKLSDAPYFNSPGAEWEMATPQNTPGFSAVGYFFAKTLQEKMKIPVAIVKCAYSGTEIKAWMSAEAYNSFDITLYGRVGAITAAQCYYGMVCAIMGYGAKGFLWYQGEGNHNEYNLYKKLLPAMVKEWRDSWKMGEMPFYYVQITPYNYKDGGNSANMRQAMVDCMDLIPNSGVVITTDAGEENNIHPRYKEVIGKRLANWAMNKSYGMTEIAYCGPVFKSKSISENRITVSFNYAEKGLTSNGRELKLFEIAGSDGNYKPAMAIIKNNMVEVWNDEVQQPVNVRYAFKDWVVGDLFNIEGLPASSFQTR
jgi:sialate O-acetylesterase